MTADFADKIGTITIKRAERMNACSLDMAGQINDALASGMGMPGGSSPLRPACFVLARTVLRAPRVQYLAVRAATMR